MDFKENILGDTVRIRRVGDDDRVVVFLHGSSLSIEMWDRQLSDNLYNDYSLIAVDFPGHGQSDKSRNPLRRYSLSGLSEFLLAMINSLKLGNYILVGLSLGSNVISESAHKLNGCKGIVLASSSIFNDAHPPAAIIKPMGC